MIGVGGVGLLVQVTMHPATHMCSPFDMLHVGFGAAGGLSIAVLFLANSAGGAWAVRHTSRVAISLGAVCLALGSAGLAAAW
jgi:hypothetical protein